jgi:hypothetical protein
MGGRGGLHDRALAGAAGVFGPARDDDLMLGRDHIEALGAILTDDVHRAAAARAGGILRFNHDLDAGQMIRQ